MAPEHMSAVSVYRQHSPTTLIPNTAFARLGEPNHPHQPPPPWSVKARAPQPNASSFILTRPRAHSARSSKRSVPIDPHLPVPPLREQHPAIHRAGATVSPLLSPSPLGQHNPHHGRFRPTRICPPKTTSKPRTVCIGISNAWHSRCLVLYSVGNM